MNNERPATFGSWLKARREALDLKQKELAHEAGCSISTLRKMEAGLRHPSREMAQLMAVALEISPEEMPAFMRFVRENSVSNSGSGFAPGPT